MNVLQKWELLASFRSSEEVATHLISEGVTGYQDDENSCPIANFLGGYDNYVSINGEIVKFEVDGEEVVYSCPKHIRQFVAEFDNGAWQELDAYEPCSCCIDDYLEEDDFSTEDDV